ncbi:unnamed protein product [Pleuronectes platessa]|uniref:Uncharacterized protein n=1 Tax=Pleuronectes platessa TaxID=8262 RepID=A0A9N7Y9P7_PLEPL|nr:unnamed protein product [Pleuronectes platessa]
MAEQGAMTSPQATVSGWVLQYTCSLCFMAALIACKVVHSLQMTGAHSDVSFQACFVCAYMLIYPFAFMNVNILPVISSGQGDFGVIQGIRNTTPPFPPPPPLPVLPLLLISFLSLSPKRNDSPALLSLLKNR